MPHHPAYQPAPFPDRLRAAQYLKPPGTASGWYQNGVRRKNVKPYYHFVWPKDKDRGTFGRLKDILQGKGPDIHLSISAQKHDYMENRPRKPRWSHWGVLSPFSQPNAYDFGGPCWVRNGMIGGRDDSKRYNFFTRKYEDFHPLMWTDATWQGPNRKGQWADQWRDVYGWWRRDETWNPSARGQTMDEVGPGR